MQVAPKEPLILLNLKTLEKIKTEERFIQPQETITERVKLERQKQKQESKS